jgi:MinD-like ATPase involved in chromosome partitioning or flagellar assembly
MLVACWSSKGGVGVSVVVAGIAASEEARRGSPALIVDLCGDQPRLHGVGSSEGAGVAGWLRAGRAVPPDALERIEEPLTELRSLLARGAGPLDPSRVPALVEALAADGRLVVVDVGRAVQEEAGRVMVDAAERSVLVTRACPLALPADAGALPVPDAIVVVRDLRRSLRWEEIGARFGAPVLAELDVDPAVGASVDAGLLVRPLPRRFVAALAAVR